MVTDIVSTPDKGLSPPPAFLTPACDNFHHERGTLYVKRVCEFSPKRRLNEAQNNSMDWLIHST